MNPRRDRQLDFIRGPGTAFTIFGINVGLMLAIYQWTPNYNPFICGIATALGFVVGNFIMEAMSCTIDLKRDGFLALCIPLVLAFVAGWVGSWAILAWIPTLIVLNLLGGGVGVFMRWRNLYHFNVERFTPRIDQSRLN